MKWKGKINFEVRPQTNGVNVALVPDLDAYGTLSELQGLVQTELEHTVNSSDIFKTILKDLDGYALQVDLNNTDNNISGLDTTVSEHHQQFADALQTILKDLDGYALQTSLDTTNTNLSSLDTTVSEHHAQHSGALQTILKDLDGYALASDLSSTDSNLSGLDSTVSEHYSQHSDALQTVLKDLDGYALLATEDQRWTDSSQQRQDLRNAADGYALDSSLTNHTGDTSNPHAVTKSQVGLGNVDNVQQVPLSQKGAANGVATLDAGGKIPSGQIPAVALPEVSVVADETARLALTVQEGDEAVQTDDGSHWIYDGSTWRERPGTDFAAIAQNVDEHYTQHSNALQTVLKDLDGYALQTGLDTTNTNLSGLNTTVSEHYSQHGAALQTVLKDLDGYALQTGLDTTNTNLSGLDATVSEHYMQHSDAIQTIISSLDGYSSDTGLAATVEEHKVEVGEHLQTILKDLDGYALFNTEGQRWTDSSQQRQDLRNAADGYALQTSLDTTNSNVSGLDQTVSEHYGQHSVAIQTIISSLDGYSSDIGLAATVEEHKVEVGKHLQTIIKDLDGYALLSTENQRWVDSSQQRQDIRAALDGYSAGAIASSQPVVQARRTTAYALTTAFADVTLDTTDVENNTSVLDHDSVTNTDRILIGDTGPYLITYHVDLPQPAAASTQEVSGRVRINDSSVIPGSQAETTVFHDVDITGGNMTNTLGKSFVAQLTDGYFISLQLMRTEVGGTGAFSTNAGITLSAVRLTGEKGNTGPTGQAGADGDITWDGYWATSTWYSTNQAVQAGGSSYVCILDHTSGASSEPGVGGSWQTYWDLMASKGDQGPASSPCTDTSATGDTTTTSTSYVLASGMTVTPAAGDYLVMWTGSVSNDTDSSTTSMILVVGGTQVTSSERWSGGAAAKIKTASIGFNCVAKVTVNGSQSIAGHWKVDVGTATMKARSLTIVGVA